MGNKVINLRHKHKVELYPVPPFTFEGTVHKPSHFPETDMLYENNIYWQTLRFKDRIYGIKLKSIGNIEKPIVGLTIYSDKDLEDLVIEKISLEIEYRFDMKTDISKFYEECGNDEILRPVIARWKGMRVSSHTSFYEFLVITTVLQNATVGRSVQMLENLFQKYGVIVDFDGKNLSSFWSLMSIFNTPEAELRSLKLGYRARILKRQTEHFVKSNFNENLLRQMPTKDLKSKLLSIYGVGPSSVQYLLFEVFKRYDALEYIPPWEQKIYSRLLFGKESVEVEAILKEIINMWGRWKMLAMHYIFEDLFWQRKNKNIPWLEKLIRL